MTMPVKNEVIDRCQGSRTNQADVDNGAVGSFDSIDSSAAVFRYRGDERRQCCGCSGGKIQGGGISYSCVLVTRGVGNCSGVYGNVVRCARLQVGVRIKRNSGCSVERDHSTLVASTCSNIKCFNQSSARIELYESTTGNNVFIKNQSNVAQRRYACSIIGGST